jgi:L-fucose mutarotase/ribose pyranase (RbsD/FucU family)
VKVIVVNLQRMNQATIGAGAGLPVQETNFTNMVAAALNLNANNLSVSQLIDAIIFVFGQWSALPCN